MLTFLWENFPAGARSPSTQTGTLLAGADLGFVGPEAYAIWGLFFKKGMCRVSSMASEEAHASERPKS